MSRVSRKDFLKLSASGFAALLATGGATQAVTMKNVRRTLIRGADILTMDPVQGELRGGDVLVEDGRIAAIGSRLAADDAEIVEAAGMILMPGMVDGHRHLWLGLHSGRLVKTDPGKYAGYQNWKMRTMVCMTSDDFHLAGYVGGLQAINSGVTSVLDYAHAHHTRDKALAGARGFLASGVSGVFCYQISHNPTYGPGDTLPVEQAVAERNGAPQESNYQTAAALRELFSDGDGPVKFGIAISEGLGLRPMTEMAEEFQRARSLRPHLICCHMHKPNPAPAPGIYGSVADLHAAGLLGPDFQVSHGVQMTDEELVMLRDSGGMICACAMGEFPYPAASIHAKARQMGIPAGLGIDVAGMALTDDYFEHVRAGFWSLYRSAEYAGIAKSFASTDVLDFATRGGAGAMRLAGKTGSITVGLDADLVLLDTRRIGFAGSGTLADRVVNFASLADIDSVWIQGVARKRRGRMIDVDWAGLKTKMAEAQERIERDAATITFT